MFEAYKPTFSRRFNGTTAYMECSSAVVTAVPLSMACWFNVEDLTTAHTLMSASDTGVTNRFGLFANGAIAGDPVSFFTGNSQAATSSAYKTGCWQHACGVTSATNSRVAYLNGGSKVTSTENRVPAGIDRFTVGARYSTTIGSFAVGRIAWPCVWNIALTDADVQKLAGGEHPLNVHPESIVAFWDWRGRDGVEYDTCFHHAAQYPLVNTASLPAPGPGFLNTRINRHWLTTAAGLANVISKHPWYTYASQV